MFGRFHLGEDGRDFPLLVDHEGGALGSHVLLPVHRFLHPDPVGPDDRLVGIAQEREGEIEFLDELGMGLLPIDAHTEEMGARFLDGIPGVADPAGLGGASRCIVLGIEIENDRRSLEFGKFQGSPLSITPANGGRGECRALIADLEWCSHMGFYVEIRKT